MINISSFDRYTPPLARYLTFASITVCDITETRAGQAIHLPLNLTNMYYYVLAI